MRDDLFAGLTGATIVLPQGVAFAAIAGLPPEYGFYTAMVTPVVAALFGSSWHTVSGPTIAISALVFSALSGLYAPGSAQFIEAAIVLAFLVGLFQIALGLARLGGLVDFGSHSVMTGFISAAALLIALSQIQHVLGLALPRPEELPEFMGAVWQQVEAVEEISLLIAAATLATGLLVQRFLPILPNYLIALLAGTLLYLALGGSALDVRTIGAIPSVIPGLADSDERHMFGQVLADFQLTQCKLGDMAVAIDASALLVYRAAWTKDIKGVRVTREASTAKLFATEAAQQVIDSAVQVFGGLGVVRGMTVESLYREVRALRIYEGASEVLKMIIGSKVVEDHRTKR